MLYPAKIKYGWLNGLLLTLMVLVSSLLAQNAQQIAYIAYNRQKHVMHLYVNTVDGSEPPYSIGLPFSQNYAWSPDGTRLAFNSFQDGISVFADIFVMDVDGDNMTSLTDSLRDGVGYVAPAWSPDGTRIAFFESGGNQGALWMINADGSAPEQLYSESGIISAPAWSLDGTHIAFTDAARNIVLLNLADLSLTALTDSGDIVSRPVWSPDGSRLLLERQSGENSEKEVFLIHADGSVEVNLSNHPARDEQPAWSPDGTQVIFTSNRDGNDEIYRVDVTGENLLNLTGMATDERGAQWSPDSSQIAFYSIDAANQQSIWLMNPDGSNAMRLGEGSYPIWQPNP